MNDKQLQDLWASQDKAAGQYFQAVEPQLETWAQQRSHSLFERVRRLMKKELWIALAISLLAPITYDYATPGFWGIAALLAANLGYAIYWYGRVQRRLKTYASKPVLESLKGRIKVLRRFVNRLRLYTYIFTPVGYTAALWVSSIQPDGSNSLTEKSTASQWALVAFSVVFLTAVIIFTERWYLKKLYGRVLKEYEATYQRLNGVNTATGQG